MKKNLLCLVFALGLFAACENNSEEQTTQRIFGPTEYDIGSCDENDPFEGDDLMEKSFSKSIKNSNYFNKEFLPLSFEAALNSSAYSVALRLFNEGVDLYRVETNVPKTCYYFDFLYTPTEKTQSNWDQIVSTSTGQGTLLGLFSTTYKKNTNTKKTKLTSSSILLADYTKKWTLLHEMSHYLYAKARTSRPDMQFNSDISAAIDKFEKQIPKLHHSFEKNKNEARALKLVRTLRMYFEATHELDARTALEEFTIESQLLDQASQNNISGIQLDKNKDNAIGYMADNSTDVVLSYRNFEAMLKRLKTNEFESDWEQAVKETTSLQQKINSINSFIEVKMLEAIQIRGQETEEAVRVLAQDEQPLQHHHFDFDAFKRRHNRIKEITSF